MSVSCFLSIVWVYNKLFHCMFPILWYFIRYDNIYAVIVQSLSSHYKINTATESTTNKTLRHNTHGNHTASTLCPIFQSRRGGKWLRRVGFCPRVGSAQNHYDLRGGSFYIIYIDTHGLKYPVCGVWNTAAVFQQHRHALRRSRTKSRFAWRPPTPAFPRSGSKIKAV